MWQGKKEVQTGKIGNNCKKTREREESHLDRDWVSIWHKDGDWREKWKEHSGLSEGKKCN